MSNQNIDFRIQNPNKKSVRQKILRQYRTLDSRFPSANTVPDIILQILHRERVRIPVNYRHQIRLRDWPALRRHMKTKFDSNQLNRAR